MKKLVILLALVLAAVNAGAQRFMDRLDRGIVAMKTTSGVFVSWRIQADEYYDVTYNLYRNGSKVAEGLTVSNYTDTGGSTSSTYQVAAVVKGKEQAKSNAVAAWANDYLEIKPKHDASLKCTYIPNDACCVDVDGDGQVEILLKYTNQQESSQGFPKEGGSVNNTATGEYSLLEVLKLDGTVLWWVNCGPNMGDFQNNEQNIVGYDWDMDGKGEVVMRLEEGSVVHMADGTTYTIGADGKNGTKWTNYRVPKTGGVEWFTHYGNEFLFYCEGATGKPYQVISYPCARFEPGETDLNSAWGDGYGHRSSKFFFGAPYLDGRKPSIFLGRGIYTRHKFVALDVDPNTHRLTERWRWMNNQKGSPWYGQGYHNYGIADVDMDGRDEIIWGSMVIDDNGKGLSTTGFGHGDAQHHGDLNPYTWGLEGFFCNEDNPSNNFRDLTTAKLYHRMTGSKDDGRAIAGNFTNTIPGAMGFSTQENPISCVTGNVEANLTKNGVGMNFRCYWDGDLCEETFNGGDNTPGNIYKYGSGAAIKTFEGLTNNSTKATPSYMGDILGDWREEFILRTADNKIRIYSTTIPTQWRNYSLWYDHQYRNGMVWEPCGYNQPPHASYFLGELEGITAAPPALTLQGRKEISNGGTISNSGEQVITCEANDMTVNVAEGATPYIYIDNAPSWVQGYAPSEATMANSPSSIKYQYYTHTLMGGAFAGDMRLVKQGEGTLVLPATTQKYTGRTEVWNGTLKFDGTMESSPVWLNRHTKLLANGGDFKGGIEADYNAVIDIAGKDVKGSLSVSTLTLNMGAKVMLDIYEEGSAVDNLNIGKLVIKHHKDWTQGPENLTPVFVFSSHLLAGKKFLPEGKYLIGVLNEVEGSLADIMLVGLNGAKGALVQEDGKLYLNVEGMRDPSNVTWTGANGENWNLAETENFSNAGAADIFVSGDNVTFNDDAVNTNVKIPSNVSAGRITVNNNAKDYVISGEGAIVEGSFYKEGTGTVTMNNINSYAGGNYINGGTVKVSSLANSINTTGNLGAKTSSAALFTIANNAVLNTTADVTNGSPIKAVGTGYIKNDAKFTLQADVSGDTIVKTGAGEMAIEGSGNVSAKYFIVSQGSVVNSGVSRTKTTRLVGTAKISGQGFCSSPINVADGANATYELAGNSYTDVSGALTGTGTVTINPTNTVNRVRITGNWSKFEGTVKVTNTSIIFPLKNSYGMAKGTLNLAANTRVSNYETSYAIGKLTGSGTLMQPYSDFSSQTTVSRSTTWKVGNSKTGTEFDDFKFDGVFSDEGGSNKCNFEKVGTCRMTVGASWTNSGTVKVTAGELRFNSGKTLGTGALTVAKGAMLGGYSGGTSTAAYKAPMTNSTITVNGTLSIGSSRTSTSGYLCLGTKALTIGANGALMVGVASCATASTPGCTTLVGGTSKTAAGGTLTFSDGATIKPFVSSSYAPTATEEKPDSFRVFSNFEKVNFGAVQYDLPRVVAGDYYYTWDTTDMPNGYLKLYRGKLAGDVNEDGVVDFKDAALIKDRFLGHTVNGTFNELAADVNADGIITIADANAIINKLVK